MSRVIAAQEGNALLTELELRLTAVEKTNHRWKWSTAALGMALWAVTSMGAEKPKAVVPELAIARKFVAVNDRGEPVAVLGHSKNVGLFGVCDDDGSFIVVASASDDGRGMVSTFDEDGNELVTLDATPTGKGEVVTRIINPRRIADKKAPDHGAISRPGG